MRCVYGAAGSPDPAPVTPAATRLYGDAPAGPLPAERQKLSSRREKVRPSPSPREVPVMKFRVERDVLADAAAWVARSLPARPPAPVLGGVLVGASSGS